ncbi:MAG: lamin tail domain-containing protein, partial [Geminicoccales bacterium]
GLHGTPLERQDLSGLFGARLVVLLGERDTSTAYENDLVRGTAEAMAQGATRLERGRHYFAASRSRARELDAAFGWRLAVAPRAAHDAAQVIDSAAFFLFVPDATPCRSSVAADAGGLAIAEILADPPHGPRGDANGDGRRDPSEDEFVEIVNTGSAPICLSGWALGDAENPERHVFPLARPLEPGQTLVVFGGGVPTGEFGGARVRTAAFAGRLNLNNAGDVLTLRDADDRVVTQISWGDCGGGACAAEHWSGELGIEGSIVRRPEPVARWAAHVDAVGTRFSPGVEAGGSDR